MLETEKPKTALATHQQIEESIFKLLNERGAGKTICPSEAARALVGKDEKQWRQLMKPIKAVAIALALDNRLVIKRKGKPIDPHALKGIYRLSLEP